MTIRAPLGVLAATRTSRWLTCSIAAVLMYSKRLYATLRMFQVELRSLSRPSIHPERTSRF